MQSPASWSGVLRVRREDAGAEARRPRAMYQLFVEIINGSSAVAKVISDFANERYVHDLYRSANKCSVRQGKTLQVKLFGRLFSVWSQLQFTR